MSIAYVMLNTVPDKMEVVKEEVKEVEGVKEAYMLYGVYDIIVQIEAENVEQLKDVILNIRKMQYISSTLTLIVIK